MRVTSTELRAAIVGHVDYDRDHRYGLNALALMLLINSVGSNLSIFSVE